MWRGINQHAHSSNFDSNLKIVYGFEDNYTLCGDFYVQFLNENIFSKNAYIYLILILYYKIQSVCVCVCMSVCSQ